MKKWNGNKAALLWTPLVSQANLKMFREPMIEMWSKALKVCTFVCAVMRFAVLEMSLETVLLYYVDVSAKQPVR